MVVVVVVAVMAVVVVAVAVAVAPVVVVVVVLVLVRAGGGGGGGGLAGGGGGGGVVFRWQQHCGSLWWQNLRTCNWSSHYICIHIYMQYTHRNLYLHIYTDMNCMCIYTDNHRYIRLYMRTPYGIHKIGWFELHSISSHHAHRVTLPCSLR